MFLIKLEGLYGNEKFNAYYRELGYCFDFVNDKKYATAFSNQDKILKILDHADWYCKQYNASSMSVVPLRG